MDRVKTMMMMIELRSTPHHPVVYSPPPPPPFLPSLFTFGHDIMDISHQGTNIDAIITMATLPFALLDGIEVVGNTWVPGMGIALIE